MSTSMSMTLYHGEPNGPSFTVLAALFEKGVRAELVRIDLAAGARHELPCAQQSAVAMSVEGEGPVLVVDGEGMTDSVFIACYLDDVGGGAPLRPSDPYRRWETMAWCRQTIERTAPAAAFLGCRAHPPKADPRLLGKIGSADLRWRWEMMGAGVFADEQLADSRSKIAAAVEKNEARLDGRSWLMGEFTIADLESYAWLAAMVRLVPDAFAGQVRTAAWMERIKGRAAVRKALSLATVADPTAYWAPGPEINRWG
ncbi:MAG TPA: glutathione S-transferase family protein [Steroidobacteraceae bacterium]|nr:glutathione S-transferase family protein [Steroidobacteraceae bacterium]